MLQFGLGTYTRLPPKDYSTVPNEVDPHRDKYLMKFATARYDYLPEALLRRTKKKKRGKKENEHTG